MDHSYYNVILVIEGVEHRIKCSIPENAHDLFDALNGADFTVGMEEVTYAVREIV